MQKNIYFHYRIDGPARLIPTGLFLMRSPFRHSCRPQNVTAMKFEDTIIAPATVPGTGAISVIRISGPLSMEAGDRIIDFRNGTLADSPGGRVKFGTISLPDGSPLDDVLVSVFREPHSYTGEDSIEISCHASSYIVDKIIELFIGEGLRIAEHGEFTKRAFINGKMDLAQAESVADLIASEGAAAHKVAISQLRGGFSKELQELRAQLLEMTSLMELELDFSEEDVEFADRSKLNAVLDKALAHIDKLVKSFKLGNAIRNGVPVAIAGPANAGKSTLLNSLLHEDRAIVSSVAGTTRDTIEETVNMDGILFRFIDTAGIRDAEDVVEKIGIDRTFKKISEADVIIGVLDCGMDDLAEATAMLLSKVDFSSQQLLLLLNKIDFYAQEVVERARKEVLAVFSEAGIEMNVVDGAGAVVAGADSGADSATGASSGAPATAGLGQTATGKPATLLLISAQSETDCEKVAGLLVAQMKNKIGSGNQTLVTNYRHYQALSEARGCLERVKDGLNLGIPTDLVSQDLREGLGKLGSILGIIDCSEILGNIFEHFCIGK